MSLFMVLFKNIIVPVSNLLKNLMIKEIINALLLNLNGKKNP